MAKKTRIDVSFTAVDGTLIKKIEKILLHVVSPHKHVGRSLFIDMRGVGGVMLIDGLDDLGETLSRNEDYNLYINRNAKLPLIADEAGKVIFEITNYHTVKLGQDVYEVREHTEGCSLTHSQSFLSDGHDQISKITFSRAEHV